MREAQSDKSNLEADKSELDNKLKRYKALLTGAENKMKEVTDIVNELEKAWPLLLIAIALAVLLFGWGARAWEGCKVQHVTLVWSGNGAEAPGSPTYMSDLFQISHLFSYMRKGEKHVCLRVTRLPHHSARACRSTGGCLRRESSSAPPAASTTLPRWTWTRSTASLRRRRGTRKPRAAASTYRS